MKRIMIMGSAGSGKSTLAKLLSEKLQIDAIHLDKEFWQPGWIMTEKPDQIRIHESFMQRDKWIIDGNYCASLKPRAENADLAIFLDMPFHLCMYRVISRYFKNKGQIREDMSPGCEEKIDREFLEYIVYYHREKKDKDYNLLRTHITDDKLVHLRSIKDVQKFLESIGK